MLVLCSRKMSRDAAKSRITYSYVWYGRYGRYGYAWDALCLSSLKPVGILHVPTWLSPIAWITMEFLCHACRVQTEETLFRLTNTWINKDSVLPTFHHIPKISPKWIILITYSCNRQGSMLRGSGDSGASFSCLICPFSNRKGKLKIET